MEFNDADRKAFDEFAAESLDSIVWAVELRERMTPHANSDQFARLARSPSFRSTVGHVRLGGSWE